MADVLSQSQIDALLKSMQGGGGGCSSGWRYGTIFGWDCERGIIW